MPQAPVRLAVLISGGGTTLKNLLDHIDQGELHARVEVVVSSSENAPGLRHPKQRGIPCHICQPRQSASPRQYSESLFSLCRDANVELVVMGGFLTHVLIPQDFENRVMNIHPALIPAFCGKGYYGKRVHQAALGYGVKVSGCTVHFVDNEYDHGPIILQKTVPVFDDDTPDTLAARVFEQECLAYPEAINLFASRKLSVCNRNVHVGCD